MIKETHHFDAILFDMDGTLIDSTPGVISAWKTFTSDYNLSRDYHEVAHYSHGRPLFESLVDVCGIEKGSAKLKEEIMRFEQEVIEGGQTTLPGVFTILRELEKTKKWTIVTSATTFYATQVLTRTALPLPQVGIVTADSDPDLVKRGKPAPDPYLAGARKVGVDPTRTLVVEDAVSGIKAGKAAGAKVLAVCTSTTRDKIIEANAGQDWIVSDLSKVLVRVLEEGGVEVVIDESLPTTLSGTLEAE